MDTNEEIPFYVEDDIMDMTRIKANNHIIKKDRIVEGYNSNLLIAISLYMSKKGIVDITFNEIEKIMDEVIKIEKGGLN